MSDLMSCGAWQPEELTLFLIQLRRHQAKMASARQHTLAQLQRLNGPKEPYHSNHLLTSTNTTSTSPLLSSVPSPQSHLGHMGLSTPLGSFNTQVGAPLRHTCLPACPSFYHGLVEVATQHIAGLQCTKIRGLIPMMFIILALLVPLPGQILYIIISNISKYPSYLAASITKQGYYNIVCHIHWYWHSLTSDTLLGQTWKRKIMPLVNKDKPKPSLSISVATSIQQLPCSSWCDHA